MTEIKNNKESGKNYRSPNQRFFAFVNLSLIVVSVSLIVIISIKVFPLFKDEDKPVAKHNHTIQVEVLNGSGTAGLADRFTDFLRSKNFDVIKTGNFSSFDIDNTFLIDRCGKKEYAFELADSLGINKSNVIQQSNKYYYLDVTLVIGKDFNKYLNQ